MPVPGPPLVESSCFTSCRRQAPTGRHANPTLAGGSDDESGWHRPVSGKSASRSGGPVKGRAMTENSNYNDDDGALLIPSRRAEDLYAGWWQLICTLGAVPRALVW